MDTTSALLGLSLIPSFEEISGTLLGGYETILAMELSTYEGSVHSQLPIFFPPILK
jgi:hypothetical protein